MKGRGLTTVVVADRWTFWTRVTVAPVVSWVAEMKCVPAARLDVVNAATPLLAATRASSPDAGVVD